MLVALLAMRHTLKKVEFIYLNTYLYTIIYKNCSIWSIWIHTVHKVIIDEFWVKSRAVISDTAKGEPWNNQAKQNQHTTHVSEISTFVHMVCHVFMQKEPAYHDG